MIYSKLTLIPFWQNTDEETGFLSQWYPSPMTINNITFSCCEQYMMYQKALLFKDTRTAEKILNAKTPKEIKALGRQVGNFNEETWNKNKEEIVYTGNYEKFNQNKKLKERLLTLTNCILVEASPYDNIWGIGLREDDPKIYDSKEWRGENLLGKILMKVRDDLSK